MEPDVPKIIERQQGHCLQDQQFFLLFRKFPISEFAWFWHDTVHHRPFFFCVNTFWLRQFEMASSVPWHRRPSWAWKPVQKKNMDIQRGLWYDINYQYVIETGLLSYLNSNCKPSWIEIHCDNTSYYSTPCSSLTRFCCWTPIFVVVVRTKQTVGIYIHSTTQMSCVTFGRFSYTWWLVVSLKYPCVCCLDVAIFGCDLNNHYFDSWNTLKHLILYS